MKIIGKYFTAILLSLFLAACSQSPNEVTYTPKLTKPSSIELPSFFEFAVCGIPKSIEDMQDPLEKIEKGLLSKKDLDQPLLDVITSIEIVNKFYLTDPKKINPSEDTTFYEDSLNDSIKIKKALDDGWLELLNESYEYYAKSRVRLVDDGIIDLTKLTEENTRLKENFATFCIEVND